MEQIAVLGGGASGIVAAIAAAENAPAGTKVILLEQNPRVGKKLLATGNGRCNLDNLNILPKRYVSADMDIAEQMLCRIDSTRPLAWFEKHGLMVRTDAEGRVYPYSNQASDFLNLLLYWLDKNNVVVKTECKVNSVRQKGREYVIFTEDGEKIYAQAVIAAFGGKAGPQFGTDGFGSRFASDAGIVTRPEYPCLVPLKCEKQQIAGLAGIRVKAIASLYEKDRLIASEEGEIQFTEQGISGIAVMQLSNRMRGKCSAYRIRLNLFPQLDKKALYELLSERAKQFGAVACSDWMTGLLNKRIAGAVMKAAGITELSRPVSRLTEKEILSVADVLSAWEFFGLAPLDWKHAQMTGGGIALAQVEPDSFRLKGVLGFYAVGEMLDCAGDCGGFNLHFAFGSGITAGIHAAKMLSSGKKNRK